MKIFYVVYFALTGSDENIIGQKTHGEYMHKHIARLSARSKNHAKEICAKFETGVCPVTGLFHTNLIHFQSVVQV